MNTVFNYIDVLDFCRVLYSIIVKPELYRLGTVNVGHPNNYKLSEIARFILESTDKISALPCNIISPIEGNPYTPCLDRMKSLLPMTYQFTSIKDSLSRLSSHYSSILPSLNKHELIADDYLNYAKSIMKK